MFIRVPATPLAAGTPQDVNMVTRSARSLGGGATTDIRIAPRSLIVAWYVETPLMYSLSGRALRTCRTTTTASSTIGCHQVSCASASRTAAQSMRPTSWTMM